MEKNNKSSNKRLLNTGIKWQSIQLFSQQIIVFILGVILARMLTPEDFGVFALLTFFIAIFEIFTEGGMGIALVQREHITQEDKGFIFTINMGLSLVSYLIIAVAAPFISEYYEQPNMKLMLRVLSLKIIIDSLRVVPYAELRRHLRFKEITIGRLIGVLLGGAAGICLVFFKVGIWCLIFQQLITTSITSLMFYIYEPWLPKLSIRSQNGNPLIKFGVGIMFFNVLNKVSKNIYTLVIGKTFSKEILGYYSRANSIENMSIRTFGTIMTNSGGTILYRLQSEKDEVIGIIERMFHIGGLLIFPILTGIILTSNEIIECLLGAKWLPAAPMLSIVCVSGFFTVLSSQLQPLYKVFNNVKIMNRNEIIKQLITIGLVTVIYLCNGSIQQLLFCTVIVSIIAYSLDAYYSRQVIGFGVVQHCAVLWKLLVCNLIMFVVIAIANIVLGNALNCFVSLAIKVVIAVITYAIGLRIMRVSMYMEIRNKILSFLFNKKE